MEVGNQTPLRTLHAQNRTTCGTCGFRSDFVLSYRNWILGATGWGKRVLNLDPWEQGYNWWATGPSYTDLRLRLLSSILCLSSLSLWLPGFLLWQLGSTLSLKLATALSARYRASVGLVISSCLVGWFFDFHSTVSFFYSWVEFFIASFPPYR